MRRFARIIVAVGAALAALALPGIALAAHGKAGLWQVTVTMKAPGQPIPSMSDTDRAQMKAMGIDMPNGHTVTTHHCVTADEANSDTLHITQQANAGCVMTNQKTQGETLTADMVCTGQMKGNGHVTVIYDGPEHYTGSMTFEGTSHGQPANVVNSFDGRWQSADCGTAPH